MKTDSYESHECGYDHPVESDDAVSASDQQERLVVCSHREFLNRKDHHPTTKIQMRLTPLAGMSRITTWFVVKSNPSLTTDPKFEMAPFSWKIASRSGFTLSIC